MSVELVKAEIAGFLADDKPGVLCLRGKWGVGKTYAWDEQLKKAHAEQLLAIKSYSYVSLFGINSLDALKFAVFENSQRVTGGIRQTGFDTIDEFVKELPTARSLIKPGTSGSWLTRFIGGDAVQTLSFMLVRNQIVCFDDLERRGDGLKPKDVLGLISFLREQRKCKVALILNDEGLDGSTRAEFETHLEKIVDVSLIYEPSPSLAASIGTDGKDEVVAARCIALSITNIRTIKRVIRLVETLKPKLADYDPEVLTTAIGSLTLFCWCRDYASEAPPLDFIASETQDTFGLPIGDDDDTARAGKDKVGPELRWRATLHAYGYMWTNEFDLVLMDAVKKGYFDDERLTAEARKESAKFIKGRREGSFEAAWRGLHDSFGDDEKEVLDGIRDAFFKNIENVTPVNLSGTVTLFKRLGRVEQASDMIARYIEARRDETGLFDLAQHPFGGYVEDDDVRAAFEKVAAERHEKPCFATLLAEANEDWSPERLEALAAAPVEEYRKAFKSHSDKELRQLLTNALHFANVGGTTEPMREMTEKARKALLTIAQESRLNALRVNRLGIVAKGPGGPSSSEAD
jgi:hypothetical protein